MSDPINNMALPNYIIYRENPSDLNSALVFFPAKDSDELFDALREKYPHRRTHSERMRDATIEFLLEERHSIEQAMSASAAATATPITTSDDFSPWQQSWPSMSSGASTLSSPETAGLPTPTFGNSPLPAQLHHHRMERATSSAASTSVTSPPTIENMTSVFSLSSSAQPKQRVRRKMTESEKAEYRKRRIVKACEKCSKRKRKCNHNQPEMEGVSNTPTIPSRITKPRTSEPCSRDTRLPKDDKHMRVRIAQALDHVTSADPFAVAGSTPSEPADFSYLIDPVPEISFDDTVLFDEQYLWTPADSQTESDYSWQSQYHTGPSDLLDNTQATAGRTHSTRDGTFASPSSQFSRSQTPSDDFFDEIIHLDAVNTNGIYIDNTFANGNDKSCPAGMIQPNTSRLSPHDGPIDKPTIRADATHSKFIHASAIDLNGHRDDPLLSISLARGAISRVNANGNASMDTSSRAIDHLLGFIPEMRPFLSEGASLLTTNQTREKMLLQTSTQELAVNAEAPVHTRSRNPSATDSGDTIGQHNGHGFSQSSASDGQHPSMVLVQSGEKPSSINSSAGEGLAASHSSPDRFGVPSPVRLRADVNASAGVAVLSHQQVAGEGLSAVSSVSWSGYTSIAAGLSAMSPRGSGIAVSVAGSPLATSPLAVSHVDLQLQQSRASRSLATSTGVIKVLSGSLLVLTGLLGLCASLGFLAANSLSSIAPPMVVAMVLLAVTLQMNSANVVPSSPSRPGAGAMHKYPMSSLGRVRKRAADAASSSPSALQSALPFCLLC
ncbi:hypothetical protein K431DRAFT_280308 [Polychaeton citri CBS 116435]|uniref:Uncharacterized protein n=1 Tax=Polychaeton citri CBS 116435 TaxID=1314669 RepID=A0A9P4QJX2_9PEZI|nr:hypothetical protein K431DRAFT_280308 [Polychaeton citri CBS 116435]